MRLSYLTPHFGILAIIVIGLQGVHAAYAAKLTTSSYTDGYSKGVRDAGRDLQGLNGHGYNSSCPSGHTSVFCTGYVRGYDNTWYGQQGHSPPPFPQPQALASICQEISFQPGTDTKYVQARALLA